MTSWLVLKCHIVLISISVETILIFRLHNLEKCVDKAAHTCPGIKHDEFLTIFKSRNLKELEENNGSEIKVPGFAVGLS